MENEIKWEDLVRNRMKQFVVRGVNINIEKFGDTDSAIRIGSRHIGTIDKKPGAQEFGVGGPKFMGLKFSSFNDALLALLKKNRLVKEESCMKSFKEKMREDLLQEAFFGEYGEIADKKKFNPENPEILVKGVGKFTRKTLEKVIIQKLEDAIEKAKKSDFAAVDEAINANNILSHYVKSILDVEKELSTPNIKRKITLMKKEAAARDLKKKILKEVSPPDKSIEDWILKNKKRFVQEYGKEKGLEVLYGRAWNMYNEKHK